MLEEEGIPQNFNWDSVEPELEEEETANSTDKTISVPSDEVWKILTLYVELTTTATAGNRSLGVHIRDAENDIINECQKSENHAASTTVRYVYSKHPLGHTTATTPTHLWAPPDLELKPAYDIRVYDVAAIAHGYDDMQIHMLVKKRKVK